MPEAEYTRHNEVDEWAAKLGVGKPRFAARAPVAPDLSHPAIAVNLDACIQCTRCVRACRDEQVNDVIGLAFRGDARQDRVRHGRPDGRVHLRGLRRMRAGLPDRRADAGARRRRWRCPTSRSPRVCPYCGVGCQLTYNVKDNKILFVEGRDGPANHGRLCVKGRYGFDYAHHPQRLTKPLIRRADAPKRADFDDGPGARDGRVPRSDLGRGARASPAASLRAIRDAHGPQVAGRLRLGQGQQRRGLPVPEAGAHRLPQQQRRPLHAAVPRLVAWPRCSKASARARSPTR